MEIEELYNSFRKPLLRFVTYKISDPFIAEEIVNDVFIKAFNSIDTLQEKEKISSWLYKIASNKVIDYYRSKKESSFEVNEELHFSKEEETSIFQELSCCIESYLEELPKERQDALKAIYLDELTQKEYAQRNNVNLSTVKSPVKRGRESLQILFKQCCNFEKDRLGQMVDYKKKSSFKCSC